MREKTDALDAAGNTTAAVGKGFAIGSAALVSLALYGAFVTRLSDENGSMTGGVNILQPLTFSFLVIGAMLPYWCVELGIKLCPAGTDFFSGDILLRFFLLTTYHIFKRWAVLLCVEFCCVLR